MGNKFQKVHGIQIVRSVRPPNCNPSELRESGVPASELPIFPSAFKKPREQSHSEIFTSTHLHVGQSPEHHPPVCVCMYRYIPSTILAFLLLPAPGSPPFYPEAKIPTPHYQGWGPGIPDRAAGNRRVKPVQVCGHF